MRNKQTILKMLIAIVFAIVSTCVLGTKDCVSEESGGEFFKSNLGIIRITSSGVGTAGVLKNVTDNTARRVAVLSYTLDYYSKPAGKDREIDYKVGIRPIFGLKEINGLKPEDIGAFTLIIDTNGNGVLDEGENKTVGGSAKLKNVQADEKTGELVEATVVFEKMNMVEVNKLLHLILVLDLSNLEEKDSFTVEINFTVPKYVEFKFPSGKTGFHSWGSVSAKHHVGNRAPELNAYATGMVDSDYYNMEGSNFTFRVRYTDPDGDGPSEFYLHLDMGDGYKKYPMDLGEDGKEAFCVYRAKLLFNFAGIKYKFSASDGELDAEGEPTKEQKLVVLPWVLIGKDYVFIKNTQVLPGQKIEVEAYFIANVNATVGWKYSEGKVFRDYTVSKIVVNEPEPLEGVAGFMRYRVILYIVPSVGFGKKSINLIEFPYSVYKKGEGAVQDFSYENILQMPDIELEIVPTIVGVEISQNEVMLGEKVKYSLNMDVFEGATVEQRTAVPTEPFKKIGDIKNNIVVLDKIRRESYEVDTWSFSMPFGLDEKTGERYYEFPSYKIKATYGDEKFEINVPGKKVRFVAPLSDEELSAPDLPVKAMGALASDEKRLLTRGTVSLVSGIVILGLVFLYFVVSFFVSSKKRKGTGTKEKRKRLEECINLMVTHLEFLESAKGDIIIGHATVCFARIQEFLNFFVTDSTDMRTKDCEFIISFLEGLPDGSSPLVGVAGQKVIFQFKDLMHFMWKIIYDNDVADKDVIFCKENASFFAEYLFQEKKRITKMIK